MSNAASGALHFLLFFFFFCVCVCALSAGVHGTPGLPVAGPGQRGDQRDEGAARAQREHAEEHLTQPRGPALPGEGPGQ